MCSCECARTTAGCASAIAIGCLKGPRRIVPAANRASALITSGRSTGADGSSTSAVTVDGRVGAIDVVLDTGRAIAFIAGSRSAGADGVAGIITIGTGVTAADVVQLTVSAVAAIAGHCAAEGGYTDIRSVAIFFGEAAAVPAAVGLGFSPGVAGTVAAKAAGIRLGRKGQKGDE